MRLFSIILFIINTIINIRYYLYYIYSNLNNKKTSFFRYVILKSYPRYIIPLFVCVLFMMELLSRLVYYEIKYIYISNFDII